jgi:hypothetical protein
VAWAASEDQELVINAIPGRAAILELDSVDLICHIVRELEREHASLRIGLGAALDAEDALAVGGAKRAQPSRGWRQRRPGKRA